MNNLLTVTPELPVSTLPTTHWQLSPLDRRRVTGARQLCPCCSYVLLRHIQSNQKYWRCGHCCQAMPVLESGATFTD